MRTIMMKIMAEEKKSLLVTIRITNTSKLDYKVSMLQSYIIEQIRETFFFMIINFQNLNH
ncbi:MAG: hypothetical protein K0R16_1630 [Nitrososphaeraceae archaeon]|nr:hypothetical protein [Nitrososphaeraceae archaeon]